ncbi:hypothetical protein BOX15_Mlig019437g1 [Macrostomum lignano]|uniref:DH domain-containing protein n=1 Tax=Macrostomum lignano TaxID=282301 RepID=A0A267E1Y0_9PLAT|nr:hypothetical protein BOX15_Mlig019437g1 [Macrostomum lignano]
MFRPVKRRPSLPDFRSCTPVAAGTGNAICKLAQAVIEEDRARSFLVRPAPCGEPLHRDADRVRGRDRRNEKRLSAGDSRERLAEQLRQCEQSLPRQDNPQLEAVSSDLQAVWQLSVSDLPGNSSGQASGKIVKQQAAIWELCHTELNILRHLKTIIEVYANVLQHLQSSAGLLTDVSTQRLFPCLSAVFQAHYTLWSLHLKPALLVAKQRGGFIRPSDFQSGFEGFPQIFQPSVDYCLSISDCKEYLRLQEKNDAFNEFVKWAQKYSARNYSSDEGSVDLQLKSLLTTPFQRITKYGLLLQEILRHTEEPGDRESLEIMILKVTEFCSQLNSRYQKKTDEDEVRVVADKLEEDAKLQDAIDSFGEDCSSLMERYRLSLLRPMQHNGQQRRKIFEGDLRLKDERGKWSEARCLLFTDMLLLARGSKRPSLRPLRSPIRLDKLVTHRLGDGSNSFVAAVLSDFGSIDSLLCLAAQDQRQCDDWLERLRRAREALLRQLQLLPQPPPKSSALQQASAATCPRCNHHSFDSAIAARPVSPKPPPPSQPERWLSEPAARTRPTLHCAHSSSELDGLRGATAAAESSQPIRLDSESTLYQQQHHQQSRSSSADDSGGGGEVGTFPASQELTPERQRLLISLSRSDGRESSQV